MTTPPKRSVKTESKRAVGTQAHVNTSGFKLMLKFIWKWFGAPALIYIVLFFIFQPHYLTQFNAGFYLDSGDGFQNVWNIWWVNESITQLHQSPYFTTMLQWPHGTTLIPQTMNIFNGLMAIPLMNVFGFSLVHATNFAVVFSFVMGGVTMFWFVQKLLKVYWVSLLAGALFTFSTYHFAHAQGHLQLVSLEWIPLFMLAFWLLVEKVRYRYALFASSSLFLVLLCDYYYFFWSVIFGAMLVAWSLYKKKLGIRSQTIRVFGLFAALSILLTGPLALSLLRLNDKADPLLGSHDPAVFGLDPLTVVLPGGSWYWGSLTSWYWSHLPYLSEMSIFFGFALLAVLCIALIRTVFAQSLKIAPIKKPDWLNFWWIVLFAFAVMSLGPRLNLAGHRIDRVPLPYAWLERVFSTLRISGMPVRWVLMSLIAAIVIVSFMLTKLNLKTKKHRYLLGIFLTVTIIDLFPARLPLAQVTVSPYVYFIKTQPRGALIDNAAVSEPQQLRNQTVHEQPLAFGYTTRIQRSVANKNFEIFADLEEGRPEELCKLDRIRYLALPPGRLFKNGQNMPIIYKDNQAVIYDLKNSQNC